MDGAVFRRVRPWLGTLVEIRVEGLDAARAIRAIEAAFAEVAAVHRCMSFHESGSDLSRLHRARVGETVRVDARTRAVLDCALSIAQTSNGCFDPTIAGWQVERRVLPRPDSPFEPDPRATWRDIELLADSQVRLSRPLWIDLGGIAKGYAVDRAIEVLHGAGAERVCVNAGGDLRVAGPRAERVHVRDALGRVTAVVDAADGAIASSTSALRGAAAQHWHGGEHRPVNGAVTVTVAAPHCMIADALTKVVLAQPAASSAVLATFGAHACAHDLRHGWRHIGAAA
jgi:thiamine biosynthesis lipoprotein